MLLDRKKYTESAYIGEELFSDSEKDRLHTLMVAERTIADGDFSLEEALEAYKIGKSEYEDYLARKTNADIAFSISGNRGRFGVQSIIHLEVLSKALEQAVLLKFHNHQITYVDRFKRELDKFMEKVEKYKEKV